MAAIEGIRPTWPREGYSEEWLALEDAAGGRYIFPPDIQAAALNFNVIFSAIFKEWPPIEEPLEIWDENTGPSHGNMPVRFYRPKSDKPLPTMVHFPGGGFMAGNLDTEDHQARFFAAKVPCLVVSVNYPLAPEFKIDETIVHGVMGVEWARAKALSVNGDPSKTLICGGSAGSVLSEQVTYHFASTRQTDVLAGSLFLYTAAAHWRYAGEYKHMHKSWDDNGHSQVPLFGLEAAEAIWADIGFRPHDPRHWIMNAKNEVLAKFPPCYLMSAEKCCFRDGGKMLEHRLQKLGVKCKYDFYPGVPHWFHVFPQLSAAHEMMRKTVDGAQFLLE